MAPVLPVYSSLPSSSSTAALPLSPQIARSTSPLSRPPDAPNDQDDDEDDSTDAEGRKGLLSGRTKREDEGGLDEGEERETLEDALRVEAGKKGCLGAVQLKPRTILLSLLSLTVALLLLFLLHPSSPYSRQFTHGPGIYSSSGHLSKNPLPSDSKYGDVPFAKVGGSWAEDKAKGTWAGGGKQAEIELENALGAGGGRRWNGTHWWDRMVIMISLDGVRADYLERGFTPHLLSVSQKGMRAEYLEPVFPSLTFPNHWSILTGLLPSSHGIVANDFWDPVSEKEFAYHEPSQSWDSEWWGGEPIWSTAVKNALRSAVLMWPGPPKMADGTKPTYWYPFIDHYYWRKKVDRVAKWLDLSYSHRPHLMTIYMPDVDQAGHKSGPHSKTVEKALGAVDEFVREVMDLLVARNLTEVVDLVVVSDHGMAETSNDRLIFLDDILGADGFASIEHNDAWPLAGLRFSPEADEAALLAKLRDAGAKGGEGDGNGFECYDTRVKEGEGEGGMLERWRFGGNERISPIYCVPHEGWAFTNHHELEVVMANNYQVKGNHGYDPSLPSMRGIFVAHGPSFTPLKSSRLARRSSAAYALSGRAPIDEDPATTVIDGFVNLEVYDLVAGLLGIQEEGRAKTNGTQGFWERYLEFDDDDDDDGAVDEGV